MVGQTLFRQFREKKIKEGRRWRKEGNEKNGKQTERSLPGGFDKNFRLGEFRRDKNFKQSNDFVKTKIWIVPRFHQCV